MRIVTVFVPALAAVACAEHASPAAGATREASPPAVALVAPAVAPSAMATPPEAPPLHAVVDAASLPIPARVQDPTSPPSGWCGETAIQEALLYLGVWMPQALVNKAGRPVHPDLYSPEIPVALVELGVRFTVYAGARGFAPFARWVSAALDDGRPVLAGVKILPTAHPEWGLDHFVLAVGHGERGLLVNTTWGSRAWVADTTTSGLSLAHAFYGIRFDGLALPVGALSARITLLAEQGDGVHMHVECMGTSAGVRYRIERRAARSDVAAAWTTEAEAHADGVRSSDVSVPAEQPARFQCAAH